MRRLRLLVPIAAIALAATLAACDAVKPGPGGPSLPLGAAHPQARDLYQRVNQVRAQNGLAPLGWNDQLGGLAQGWSQHMAATGTMSHQNLGAILQNPAFAGFSGLAENVIGGPCGMSTTQMHDMWMGSSAHRANILGNFSSIGIGIACNGSSVFAAEEFGR